MTEKITPTVEDGHELSAWQDEPADARDILAANAVPPSGTPSKAER